MMRFSSFRRLLTHLNMATMRVYPALTPLPHSQPDELSIMSFNILTKAFAEKHYYRYISPLHAEWSYRHPILKEVLANYGVDILCLQECDPFSFHLDFGQYFRSELGYEFIIDSKDTKRAKYLNDPVAAAQIIRPSTLYKSDRFKVIHNEFRSRSIVTLFQIVNPQNDGANGNENEHRFVFIVNVHLEGAPKKWAVRFKQIKSILSRITFRCTELGLDPLTVPVIICGDFNDGMYSVITKTLTEGGLDRNWFDPRFGPGCRRNESECKEDYRHEFVFKDAYHVVFEQSLESRPPTFAGNGIVSIVDYLYFTSNNLQCLGVIQPLPHYMLNMNELLLPNQNWVSDHLPIAGSFKVLSTHKAVREKQKGRKSERKNKRQKMKKKSSALEWKWYEMKSF